jgi:hypothetical protein
MRVQRRTTPIWAFIILVIALLFGARAVGLVPDGLFDLIVRAWPALLVLGGLVVLLRDRVPLSGLVALVLTGVLTVGLAAYAFNLRAAQPREGSRQAIAQSLPANISLLRVRVIALATDVTLDRALDATADVTGEYVGSEDNRIELVLEQTDSDNSVTLTLREERISDFPFLETVGRGALQLDLPPAIPLDVEFSSTDGDITLNLSGTSLERLNVYAGRGDVLVTLPSYLPQYSERGDSLGTVTAQNGALTLRVPRDVAARLEMSRGASGIDPQYDPNAYNYLIGDVLEARQIETAAITVRYSLVAPRGLIRLDVP